MFKTHAAGVGQALDATGARDSNAAVRIAALQNSLFAQAALPPEKVESLKVAVQARAQRTKQLQQQQHTDALSPAARAPGVVSGAAADAAAEPAVAVGGSSVVSIVQAQSMPEQVAAAADQHVSKLGTAGAAASDAVAAQHAPAAAVVDASDASAAAAPAVLPQLIASAATAAAAAAFGATAAAASGAGAGVGDDMHMVHTPRVAAAPEQPEPAAIGLHLQGATSDISNSNTCSGQQLTHQQRRAAAAAAAADAADHRASVVAAALTVVGVVEQCTSQLLMALMVLYCLCFLPSIIPGLQPPHLVQAMSRRPAWMEGLLLLGLHWFAVTNVSIVRAASQRPRTSMEAHRAAVAAFEEASSAMVAATAAAAGAEDVAALEARRRRRRKEHRLLRLRDRQQRLLGRAMLSSFAAAVALGLLCYSLCVFALSWVDQMLGDGAGVVWVYRRWNEWQEQLTGRG
jgi:hypothetical protein